MELSNRIAAIFRMSPEVWERHANPWSVWTRVATLPVLVLAIWSREWIGGWALLAFVAVLVWIYLNPRIFAKPLSTDNWSSQAVLGERVWLNRADIPIPDHHAHMAQYLSVLSGVGLPFLCWGLIVLSPWPTLFGMTLVYAGKLWFLDRMVWLYQDMKDQHREYRAWLY